MQGGRRCVGERYHGSFCRSGLGCSFMALRLPGTLSARITIGFMVLVVTFAVISVSTVLTIDRLNQAIRIIHAGYLQLALVSGDLDTKQDTLRSYLREELSEEDSAPLARKRLERLVAARRELLSKTEGILLEARKLDGVSTKQFTGTAALVTRMRELVDEVEPKYLLLDAEPSKGAEIRNTLLRLELRISPLTDELKKHETKMVLKLSERLDVGSRKTWRFTMLWGAMAVVLGILMTIGATVMLRPLRRLREAAGRIARGDYAHRIPVRGPREIAELAQEFNIMGGAIEERSRELVRTERLATVGKMAAMITHEVRNPLSSIGLNTELLEEEMAALPPQRAEEAKSLCRAITTEVDRLTEITEEYLQLARLPKPKLRQESIERVIRSLAGFVEERLRVQGVEIQLELQEDGPELALDEGQIRQALHNLLRNAADALEGQGGGVVRISVEHRDGESELRVADNGSGVPEDLLDRLFEAFVSSKTTGTGLGLAVTHQIISGHRGIIEVENAPEGGAVFRIILPRG